MKWSWESYWQKARLYSERANEFDHTDSRFGFLSALTLEFLARSALTKIHPMLNADPRSDENLLYAIGVETKQPRSLPVHAVYLRLEKTVAGFGKVQRELCDFISLLRNEELHTGTPAFEGVKESQWLPRYYETCDVLCRAVGKTLSQLLGKEIAKSAAKLIETLNKAVESTVKKRIAEHKKAFGAIDKEEQRGLQEQAEMLSHLASGAVTSHPCPACGSKGALKGELIKQFDPDYHDEMLVMDEEYLAVEFECFACGLPLTNIEEILHAKIEPRFKKQVRTSLHELFEPEEGDPYMNM